jgi:sporulation protein YlmC with PRC-barrel domain
MKHLTTLAVATILAMGCVPAITTHAFAQTLSTSGIVAQDHSMRSSKLIGMEVFDLQGKKIGKIEDILVKSSATEPLVVLSVGGFIGGGPKMVAVPLSHITVNSDKMTMPATKAEMASMQAWSYVPL